MEHKIEKTFFTAEEISQILIIPLNTIYRLTKTGKIKGMKIGKQWRYLKTDVEDLIHKGISPRILPARINPDIIERRNYPRLNCNISCRYAVNILPVKTIGYNSGIIKNISGGGLLLCDRKENILQLAIDDPVHLEFDLPNENRIKKIFTKGRVVRIVENTAVVYVAGIKFRNMDKDYQDEITNYVG